VKRGGSLSFLVGTMSNVLVMEIGWTDVGSGGYILVSCAHSNTSLILVLNFLIHVFGDVFVKLSRLTVVCLLLHNRVQITWGRLILYLILKKTFYKTILTIIHLR
jgi:hypothetical protein